MEDGCMKQKRIYEIAYAVLLANLSKQNVRFDPQQFKKKLDELPQKRKFLPKGFRDISAEELRKALKAISHALVDNAYDFKLKTEKKKK
jgi:hypothetical protein